MKKELNKRHLKRCRRECGSHLTQQIQSYHNMASDASDASTNQSRRWEMWSFCIDTKYKTGSVWSDNEDYRCLVDTSSATSAGTYSSLKISPHFIVTYCKCDECNGLTLHGMGYPGWKGFACSFSANRGQRTWLVSRPRCMAVHSSGGLTITLFTLSVPLDLLNGGLPRWWSSHI